MVTFYKINDDGSVGEPVLFLDTLKVSTIEQTAETAEARGGKGNPVLVSWDYGKEINVSIEDALFSPKSMAIMFGNGSITKGSDYVQHTATIRADATTGKLAEYFIADVYDSVEKGAVRKKIYIGENTAAPAGMIKLEQSNLKLGITGKNSVMVKEDGSVFDSALTSDDLLGLASTTSASAALAGQKVMFTYFTPAVTNTIVISGDTFPGTYYVTGDTYARSDVTGKDQLFQFVIPKAKMQAENTITLEAEGDPSVFNMGLKVLRPDNGEMMKLIQYELTGAEG